MSFCPKCSYSLDLRKNIITMEKNNKNTIEKKKITSVSAGITQIVKNNIEPSLLDIKFSRDQMTRNKKFAALSMEDKNKMYEIFKQDGGGIDAMFSCNNCGWSKVIKNSTKLYSFDTKDNVKKILPDEYLLLVNNPIYSRTKDYTCKNDKCPTHKDFTKKEAIFYHGSKDLNVTYVCTECLSSWALNSI